MFKKFFKKNFFFKKEIQHLQRNIPWPKGKRLQKKKKQESKTWKTLFKKDKEKKAERKSEKVLVEESADECYILKLGMIVKSQKELEGHSTSLHCICSSTYPQVLFHFHYEKPRVAAALYDPHQSLTWPSSK